VSRFIKHQESPTAVSDSLNSGILIANVNLSSGATTKWLLSLEFLVPSEDRRLGMVDRGPEDP